MKINRQRIVPAFLFLFANIIIVTVLMYTAFVIYARTSGDTVYVDSFPVIGEGVKKERLRAQDQRLKEDLWAQEYAELPRKNYGEWTSDILHSRVQVGSLEWKKLVWVYGSEVVKTDIRAILFYPDGTVIGELPSVSESDLREIRRMVDHSIITTVNAKRVEQGFSPLRIDDSRVEVKLSQINAFIRWLLLNPLNLVMLIMLGAVFAMFYPFFGHIKNAFSSKSISRPYRPTNETVYDVGGLPKLKELVEHFTAILEYPHIIRSFGGDIMPGILFSGSPGTGKSMCARVLANIAASKEIYIREIRCGGIISTLIPEAASERIQDIFRRARKYEQALLIFDEVEAFTRVRRPTFSGAEEGKSDALVEFLSQLDGVAQNDKKGELRLRSIIVLAMTNRPELIDEALLRSERIGFHLEFPVPQNTDDRKAILEIHSRDKKLPPDKKEEWLTSIAENTKNFSGADLKALMENAATRTGVRYAKQGRKEVPKDAYITLEDLEEARKEILQNVNKQTDPIQ